MLLSESPLKSRSNFAALDQFVSLNARQLHGILSQYQGNDAGGDDRALLQRVEEMHPKLHSLSLAVDDSLAEHLAALEEVLRRGPVE